MKKVPNCGNESLFAPLILNLMVTFLCLSFLNDLNFLTLRMVYPRYPIYGISQSCLLSLLSNKHEKNRLSYVGFNSKCYLIY